METTVATTAVCMANADFEAQLPSAAWAQTGFLQTVAHVDACDCPKVGPDVAQNLIAWHATPGCDQNGQLGSLTEAELARPANAAGHAVGAWAVFEADPGDFSALGCTPEFEPAAMTGAQRCVCQLHAPCARPAPRRRRSRRRGTRRSWAASGPRRRCL